MLDVLDQYPVLMVGAIFLARVCDVSLGTLRTIVIFRGYRLLAALLGFFEVLIWLLAAGQVIRHLDVWYLAVAYAAGFATGNIVGSWLEAKLAIGLELVRIISTGSEARLAPALTRLGYDVTELSAVANDTRDVEVVLVVERRRRVPELMRQVAQLDPTAVCTMNDVKRLSTPRLTPMHRPGHFLTDWLRVSKRK
jgi:uncharacterized protein YebE (UPF0316 family)